MSETLDQDIAAVLEAEGLRAVHVEQVSTIRAAALRRSTYRIDLETGETIKARRLEDAGTAQRLFAARRDLPDAFVPAIVCRGPVLLEEWIEGRLLGPAQPDDARLHEAGLLLARVHAATVVDGQPVRRRERSAAWRDEAERGLEFVVAAGELEEPAARSLRGQLARHDPGFATVGLTHVDFCGENMLIDRAGRLRVFDNDRVGVGPLGFDVARSWYRWALAAPAWARVERAYAGAAPSTEALDALGFWAPVAVVKSAVFRLRLDAALARVPLDRLRLIAAAAAAGERS
jgi:hypothetical protein